MPYIVWCDGCSLGHHEEHQGVVSELFLGKEPEANEICICSGECERKFGRQERKPESDTTVGSLLDIQDED